MSSRRDRENTYHELEVTAGSERLDVLVERGDSERGVHGELDAAAVVCGEHDGHRRRAGRVFCGMEEEWSEGVRCVTGGRDVDANDMYDVMR